VSLKYLLQYIHVQNLQSSQLKDKNLYTLIPTHFSKQGIHNCQLMEGRCKGKRRKWRDVKSDPNTLPSRS